MIQRIRDVGGPALIVLATISFVSSLGISIMLPLLPLYALSLGASPLELGLMTSGFAVANGVAQFASGFLMDRFGARRFVVAGIGTYAAANVLIATAATATALIGYRFIAGLGGGVNMVATRLYISQTAEAASLAFFNSIISAANSAGSSPTWAEASCLRRVLPSALAWSCSCCQARSGQRLLQLHVRRKHLVPPASR